MPQAGDEVPGEARGNRRRAWNATRLRRGPVDTELPRLGIPGR